MLRAPNIDPVAIHLGPVQVHWYGLMYVIGFVALWWLATRRAKKPGSGWTEEQVSDIVFYGALGVILGGRLGYVLFYNFSVYLANPLSIFRVWDGGMSFHGGLMGVLVSLWWWGRQQGKHVFEVTDFIAPWVPIGLAAGRVGNFINQELWGRVTDAPWGMVFRGAGDLPRHPSQLYQAGLEGLVLLVILILYSRKPRPYGAVSGMLGIFYGLFRFLVEFVREPDAQLGFVLGSLTMGQLLSLPMIIIGGGMVWWAYSRKRT
jgi:phosphatidylglycerol:prolipoprotein diacylglycerol transferase